MKESESRQALSPADFSSLFASFRRSAFRLETLDAYNVAEEAEFLAQHLAGQKPKQINQEWCDLVKARVAEGKRMSRVRVTTIPFSTYVSFEIDNGYRYSIEAGEEIGLLDRRLVPSALLPLQDFWLFDSAILVTMEYDAGGRFLRGVRESDEGALNRALQVETALETQATPLEASRIL